MIGSRKDRKDDSRVERVGLCLGGRSWSSELELESGVLGVRNKVKVSGTYI